MKLKFLLSRWLPVFTWAAIIFSISAIPEPLNLTPTAFALALQKIRLLGISLLDVLTFLIHFSLYLGLGILAARAIIAGNSAPFPILLAVFVLCFLYALSDEFHQTFVPGRGFEAVDLLADSIGTITGIRLWLLTLTIKNMKTDHLLYGELKLPPV